MTEFEKMVNGQLYQPSDPELRERYQVSRNYQRDFNSEENADKREKILRKWLGQTGEDIFIEPSFFCDYGVNIHLGDHFYANFNCTFLDVCPIHIGEHAMLGPNVQILTPLHPLDPEERISGFEYGAPVKIGKNFWAGAGAIILPGVTLGDNVVVGAGSVVTKSFGDNVLLAGNPARVIRPITEADRLNFLE